MKSANILLVGALFCLAWVGRATAQPEPDARESHDTAILEAVRLLEAKDYAKFLKSFVDPREFDKIIKNTTLDEFAEQFGERKAPRLLKVLKAAKDVKPTLNSDGTQATYKLKDAADGKVEITFEKVGKYWYIRN